MVLPIFLLHVESTFLSDPAMRLWLIDYKSLGYRMMLWRLVIFVLVGRFIRLLDTLMFRSEKARVREREKGAKDFRVKKMTY